MRLTKWVKIDQIIENYQKDYPKRWKSFVREMDKLRRQEMGEGELKLSAKFPAS